MTLLRDMIAGPITLDQAKAVFTEWKRRSPWSEDDLDRWIAFLKAFALVETEHASIGLTVKGRAFLRFLQEFNKPDPKNR